MALVGQQCIAGRRDEWIGVPGRPAAQRSPIDDRYRIAMNLLGDYEIDYLRIDASRRKKPGSIRSHVCRIIPDVSGEIQ